MPDLDAPDAVAAALWIAFGAWAIWWSVPLAIGAFGGTRYANGGEENPGAIEPDGSDPAYATAFAALRALGYEPLGPGWMRLAFYLRFWVYRTKVRAFRKRSAGRFAFLHEGPNVPGWHQVYFATCWADGGLDLTVGGLAESFSDVDGFACESLPTDDPAELEARHAARVAACEAAGRRRDTDLSLSTLLDATERHAQLSTLGPTAQLARMELKIVGISVAIAVGIPASIVGPWHWLPPAVGLVALGIYTGLLRLKTAQYRAHLRARAAGAPDEGW